MLFILFHIGADRYALPAREVAEVLPLVKLKELPGAPSGVAGVMDYRGTAVPVIDLSALAIGRGAARRVSTRIIMTRREAVPGDRRLLGLLVEHATRMMNRAAEDFQPAGVRGTDTPYLGPVVADEHGLIQRLELGALLTEQLRQALVPVDATP